MTAPIVPFDTTRRTPPASQVADLHPRCSALFVAKAQRLQTLAPDIAAVVEDLLDELLDDLANGGVR